MVNKRQKREVNWLLLPDHILALIASKLIDIKDYIRYGAVSRSLQCVYKENMRHYSPPTQPPLLMLTSEHDHNHYIRSIYSPSERRVSNFPVPLPHNKDCRGSSHGWLLLVDRNLIDYQLFNPFLLVNNEIKLPPLTAFELGLVDFPDNISNVVLSANPASNSNYVVMAKCGNHSRLVFFKPGDKTWTAVEDWDDPSIKNVVYYSNRFYVVDCNGELFACDVNHPHPKLLHVAVAPPLTASHTPPLFPLIKRYLVESSGDLLQVYREMDLLHRITTRFEVFRLDSVGRKWVEAKSLDGQVLFIGDNSSICISSSDFPGCKPNCIYFTHDTFGDVRDKYDTGVFYMEDGMFEWHYPVKSKMKIPAASWIEPTLRSCFVC